MSELAPDQLRTLLAVVEHGTFDAAAHALHVTPSAVSQRLKALEHGTGRVLVRRSKPVRLTESGQILVRYARQLAQLEHDARAELGLTRQHGPARLPIAVNADSLATWFLPAITNMPAESGFCVELHREDQSTTTELLRAGLVLAAVTSAVEPVTGCTVRRLGRMRYLPTASPGLIARWLPDWPAVPLTTTLPATPLVAFDRNDDLQDQFLRELGHTGTTMRHLVPSSEGFVEAIASGMGWGMVPEPQALPHLATGALINLDTERAIDVPLFWQQWKLDSPPLTATARAVANAASRALRD
ncbi:LysR family transcriptional regulator [Tamaricihabitans halophyticus]|uniref:HTH-type transcriptional regulator LysG n=1 Tax=Tamaricihabitans halophyticus TaxID=1262583 RepID=A0A4R2QW88_9PSEU|nr:LysR family transcriptional regulator ArgP [Tamaricihabitans halophyticus]TCP53524.1 LysR family transcriptional regulator [Tamaricihabitans halophyticus]